MVVSVPGYIYSALPAAAHRGLLVSWAGDGTSDTATRSSPLLLRHPHAVSHHHHARVVPVDIPGGSGGLRRHFTSPKTSMVVAARRTLFLLLREPDGLFC